MPFSVFLHEDGTAGWSGIDVSSATGRLRIFPPAPQFFAYDGELPATQPLPRDIEWDRGGEFSGFHCNELRMEFWPAASLVFAPPPSVTSPEWMTWQERQASAVRSACDEAVTLLGVILDALGEQSGQVWIGRPRVGYECQATCFDADGQLVLPSYGFQFPASSVGRCLTRDDWDTVGAMVPSLPLPSWQLMLLEAARMANSRPDAALLQTAIVGEMLIRDRVMAVALTRGVPGDTWAWLAGRRSVIDLLGRGLETLGLLSVSQSDAPLWAATCGLFRRRNLLAHGHTDSGSAAVTESSVHDAIRTIRALAAWFEILGTEGRTSDPGAVPPNVA